MTKMRRTPAATKIWAAIARRMLVGRETEAIRRVKVVVLAMQKPRGVSVCLSMMR